MKFKEFSVQEDIDTTDCQVGKGKGIPRQAEVTLGVPGRLRSRIFGKIPK